MTTPGPKAQRRRKLHLIRLVFWAMNLVAALAVYTWDRPLFTRYSIPYLLGISLAALIEGAWSSYAADSPLDE